MTNAPNSIIAAALARRIAAGLSVRVTFSDGRPDFTGHYRNAAERDAKIAAARNMDGVASVETIA